MKKVLHFFSYPLHIFLGVTLIVLIWFTQTYGYTLDFPLQESTLIPAIGTCILLSGFLSSVIYILIGTLVFVLGDTKKAPEQKAYAKKMLISGFIVLILCLIGYYILQFALEFYGLTLKPSGAPKIVN